VKDQRGGSEHFLSPAFSSRVTTETSSPLTHYYRLESYPDWTTQATPSRPLQRSISEKTFPPFPSSSSTTTSTPTQLLRWRTFYRSDTLTRTRRALRFRPRPTFPRPERSPIKTKTRQTFTAGVYVLAAIGTELSIGECVFPGGTVDQERVERLWVESRD